MSTWLNRGASGGLAGALKTEKKSVRPNQSTASHTEIRTPPEAFDDIIAGLADRVTDLLSTNRNLLPEEH